MKTPKMHDKKTLLLSKEIISKYPLNNIKLLWINTGKKSKYICDSAVDPVCRGEIHQIDTIK